MFYAPAGTLGGCRRSDPEEQPPPPPPAVWLEASEVRRLEGEKVLRLEGWEASIIHNC